MMAITMIMNVLMRILILMIMVRILMIIDNVINDDDYIVMIMSMIGMLQLL